MRDTPESPETVRRASLAAWITITLFAATLLVIARGPHKLGAFDVESDFYGGYATAAQAIQHGHLASDGGQLPAVFGFVGPLYPTLLALGGFALGDLFDAAELLSLIGATSVLICWFLLVRRRVSARLAFILVLLLATNPVLVRYGYSATTDATSLAMQAAAMLMLFTLGGLPAAVGAGLFAGLATLTRYTCIYLVPAGIIAIGSGATRHARRKPAALAYLGGFIVLALPWQVYARWHGAEVQFHQLLAFDVYANARGIAWDVFLERIWPRFQHSPLSVFTTDPGAVASRLILNLFGHLRLDAERLLRWPVAAVAALAPVLTIRDRRLLKLVPLVLPGAWAFLALVPAAHNERYSLAVLPFYLLLAGATLTTPWWWGRGPGSRLLQLAAIAAVAGSSIVATVSEQMFVLEQQPLEILACAQKLKRLARADDRVIARKPNLAYHAGVTPVYFPALDSLPSLARHARDTRTRWLFISPAEVQMRPRLAFLLDSSAAVPGLTMQAYASVPAVIQGLQWRRVAVLYEIGPQFGQLPAWFANDTLRALHTLRGMAVTLPDARLQLQLARVEWFHRDLAASQTAWRDAARIDPAGFARLLERSHGDTLLTVLRGLEPAN